ncbi:MULTISPECIES: hypothetical protein [unclassified Tardiphaga]|uniref:hypothetical protein n=1 Tax=unclassified Tardiphaga TaxID=2631404 RepID=UPI00143DE6D7|nr:MULTISPECIES: hypothetical protein [unclassified Tardiphaga]MBC7586543.1 hypothetical protein [Tardiphaga sp.]
MAIINPWQLFDQADRLIAEAGGQQVDLRRAVSAAYYGLFHSATIAASDFIVSKSRRNHREWSLVSRSIDHKDLRELCKALDQPPGKYRPFIPAMGFSAELKDYARAVVELQQKRHDADYDPIATFRVSDCKSLVASARNAATQFKSISVDADEWRIFICLLLFPPR